MNPELKNTIENTVVSFDEHEAQEYVNSWACTLRVVRNNGNWLIGTRDYREDRLNVEVEHGIITKTRGWN